MAKTPSKPRAEKRRCGLCGKSARLVQTKCCGHWICDDADQYVLFSYARNSCYRNHALFTICGYHHLEGHKGDWKDCKKCRKSFATEMYVWYATNEYNFEKLANPPSFEPTHCVECGVVIKLGTDGYTRSRDGYWCETCAAERMGRPMQRPRQRRGKR